ncbi:MAG: HlyD family efflux transporter periplasmic adaptor subunit [Oscillospiraceae bacterium]|jgi:multidrug resistance efflux pump|nr:HlyD family efflux transporter periplasmic adaptor subunit [Oscillospiraceae bacterium]
MDNSTYTVPQENPQTEGAIQQPQSPPAPPAKRRRPGRRKKIIKNIIAAVITLGVIGVLVWFTYSVFYSEPEEYYLTGAIEVWPEIKNEVTGWGWLRPAESKTVSITQQGNVLECYAFQGMMVNEGDVLAVIDSSVIDKAIEGYNKDIGEQEKEIDRLQIQIDKTNEQIQEVNADQIAMSRAARLNAPFAGRAVDVPKLTIGEQIKKGTPLGRLIDDSKMTLTLYFSYGYENDIYIGQSAEVSIPGAMATVSGRVSNIEKIRRIGADGSVSFEVEVTMNNPGSLVSGMVATASMRTASNEIILPAEPSEPYKLDSFREIVLTAESEGPLKEFNLRDHYTVNEGDLLMLLEFIPDTSKVDGYMQAIEGYREGIEKAETNISDILEKIDLELERIDSLTIRAPISGTITFTNLEWGMKITETAAGTVNIAQLGTLTMEAGISQSEIHIFSVGMDVDVQVWTQYGETWIKGSITHIDTSAKQENQWAQYPVIIAVDNTTGMLMDGSSANFSARLAYSENAIVVPIQAVKNIGRGEHVFLKPKDGKAPESAVDVGDEVPPGFYAIPVKTGITNGRYIEITEGLLHEWEGWEVFTQKTDIAPSPSPSSHYEGENDDPNYIEGYDDGYGTGYDEGLEAGRAEASGGGEDFWPGDGSEVFWPEGGREDVWPDDGGFVEDGYFDEDGNWVPFLPDGGGIDGWDGENIDDGGEAVLPEDGEAVLPDDGGMTILPGDGMAVQPGGGGEIIVRPVPVP